MVNLFKFTQNLDGKGFGFFSKLLAFPWSKTFTMKKALMNYPSNVACICHVTLCKRHAKCKELLPII
jgi:hypothetical protein